MLPFTFRPGKVELWILGVIALLYYTFITVPAAPRALWVLPLCLGITFWALRKNRIAESLNVESRPDAISVFDQKVRPLNYAMLFAIPAVATGIDFVALAADLRVPTNRVVYYGASLIGSLMWVSSIVILLRNPTPTHLPESIVR